MQRAARILYAGGSFALMRERVWVYSRRHTRRLSMQIVTYASS
jgi:hypothetical protein